MKFINNLSMRGKLITLVVPALLVILFFAAESVVLNQGKLDDMRQLLSNWLKPVILSPKPCRKSVVAPRFSLPAAREAMPPGRPKEILRNSGDKPTRGFQSISATSLP